MRGSIDKKDLIRAEKSKKPVVFLGGYCQENKWREDLKKEFGKDIVFLDPYDKDWDPKENVYFEIAGMIDSGWVIFYKGGEQSDKEKEFLDMIGRKDKISVREFDDIESLKNFLNHIKGLKLSSISSVIKKCAMELLREAMPFADSNVGSIDFYFELLDRDSIKKIIKDFEDGFTITIPEIKVSDRVIGPETFSIKDFNEGKREYVLNFMKRFLNKPGNSSKLYYDNHTHVYKIKKMAKHDVVYEFSCAMVDLPKVLSKEVIEWGKKNVPDKDLFKEDDSKGREDEIHITLFYGIKDKDPTQTGKILKFIEPFEVRLGLINAFKDKSDYDVLKIEVESGDLEKLHYEIEKKIDNKNDYPTYKPHVTILYAKKGVVDKFIGDESFKGKTFKVSEVVFSTGKDKDYVLPLNK